MMSPNVELDWRTCSLVLVASDDELLAAARAEGLVVDDPRAHP
jgi:hypothetical protein